MRSANDGENRRRKPACAAVGISVAYDVVDPMKP
jgi:hypothetical protein